MAKTNEKEEQLDPNLGAMLQRIDLFIPAMVAAMEQTTAKNAVNTKELAEQELAQSVANTVTLQAQAKASVAAADQAEIEVQREAAKLEADKVKTSLLQQLSNELAGRILKMSTSDMTDVMAKLDRGY